MLQDILQKYKIIIENSLVLNLEEVKNEWVALFTSASSNNQVSTATHTCDNKYIFVYKAKF